MIRSLSLTSLILSVATCFLSAQSSPEQTSTRGASASQHHASVALVLDNSKSMASKRDAMVKAMHLLIEHSDPEDEFLVVNFNVEPYLDQKPTNDRNLVGSAIDKAVAQGGTALYDALGTSAAYLNKTARFNTRVVVFVADHGDNMSHISANQLIQQLQNKTANAKVFCLALFDPGDEHRTAEIFRQLAKQTGGRAYFVPKLKKLNETAQEVAEEIGKAAQESP